ncbi:MAG TPA: STAS domain-containing protein [Rectinemataceae bacterium]|nr:STAS domain-containing protein [Rectinemataceae bacterium]
MSPSSASLESALSGFSAKYPGTRLSLAETSSPPALVIRLDGALDTQNSGDFQAILAKALETAKERGALVLDLSRLNYISSTGVGALTQVLVESKRHQLPFFLCHISDQARSILDVLGFTSFFPVLDECGEVP